MAKGCGWENPEQFRLWVRKQFGRSGRIGHAAVSRSAGSTNGFRSDPSLQLFAGDLAVPKNLGKESPTDCFTPVDRNNGAPAVRMAEEMVAALDADEFKPQASQRLGELGAVECGKRAHAMTATR